MEFWQIKIDFNSKVCTDRNLFEKHQLAIKNDCNFAQRYGIIHLRGPGDHPPRHGFSDLRLTEAPLGFRIWTKNRRF